ncbi:MAG: hypothetical protein NZM18_00985 [Thermoflexales bacterium]|nr:hypothetical protein [Thermoflexales bacterium]
MLGVFVGVVNIVTAQPMERVIAPNEESGTEKGVTVGAAHLQSTVVALAAGADYNCAVMSGGQVYCWGSNQYGQLGIGVATSTAYPTPRLVSSVNGVVAIAAGWRHTCAATSSGQVYCWGLNHDGQLGNSTHFGTYHPSPTPTLVANLNGVVALAAGHAHTCARTNTGQVYCWGWNRYAQLGNEMIFNPSPTPTLVNNLIGAAVLPGAGSSHTCTTISWGQLYCWGQNHYGQLGISLHVDSYAGVATPTLVSGIGGVTALALGGSHTCAAASGHAYCWGWNQYSQLGNHTNVGTSYPVPTVTMVSGLPSSVAALATGRNHTCAATSMGSVYCWGWNQYGQLGNTASNNHNPFPNPQLVLDVSGVTALAAGDYHTCALAGGEVYCWGSNDQGQLGNTVGGIDATPRRVDFFPNPPGAFSKIGPSNGTVTHSLPITLRWQPASGTVNHYRFCYDGIPGCTPNQQATSTEATIPWMGMGGTFYWQVRACANVDCTIYTDASNPHWSFVLWHSVPPNTGVGNTPGQDDADLVANHFGTSKAASPTTVMVNELVTFTLTLMNGSAYTAVVNVTDTLPVGISYVGVVGSTPAPIVDGQVLRWEGVNVPATGMTQLMFRAQATTFGLFENRLAIGDQDTAWIWPIRGTARVAVLLPHLRFVPIVYTEGYGGS